MASSLSFGCFVYLDFRGLVGQMGGSFVSIVNNDTPF